MQNPSVNTRVWRSASGWQARTEIELDQQDSNSRVLTLSTYRSQAGRLMTCGNVSTINAIGGLSHVVGRDYNEVLQSWPCPRATEKTVCAQHDKALASLPDVRAAIERYYADQGVVVRREVSHA